MPSAFFIYSQTQIFESVNLSIRHFDKLNERVESSILFHCLLNSNGNGDGSAYHRVVAHAEEPHHLDVCRD